MFWDQALVGQKQLISNVNNIVFYTVPHNSTHVLRRGPLVSSVIESIGLIGEEAKGYTCRYFKTMKKSINPVLYTWVIIERIAIEVIELRGVSLKGRALDRYGDIGLDKGDALESDEVLETLHKEYDIPIVYVFLYQYYLTLPVYHIEVGVKVS